MKNLKSGESEIIGKWILSGGKILPDINCERIEWLVNQKLKKIANKDAWEILYIDPGDGRYWEKVYLESELHGGGPPSLICIGKDIAIKKYQLRDE